MTPGRSIPNTPVARRRRIVELLSSHAVDSPSDLAKLLVSDGLMVEEAEIVHDLETLGAVAAIDAGGSRHLTTPAGANPYAGPESPSSTSEAHLARLCQELLVSADASGNLVVTHTPPGAAQFFASALDLAAIDGVVGTVAGDDTVLAFTDDPVGGPGLATYLTDLAEGAPKHVARQ